MNKAPDPRLEEVAEQIYAHIQPPGGWCLNNSGILVGPDSVTLIDTAATERRARALRAAMESVTPLPARTVVNTHHHGDHTYGNGQFVRDAVIIGHDECPAEMLEQGKVLTVLWPEVEWGDIEIVPPGVTFADKLTMFVGELRVELMFVGPAHTTNDAVAWLPEHELLFSGDVLFNGITPFVLAGSVAGSLAALPRLRSLGARTIVPGHGAVAGPELFDRVESYLRWIQGLAREGAKAGLPPLAAAREAGLGEYGEWLDSERIVGNLHRAYSEERGEPLGTPLDLVTAIMEMVEFNGGRPLTCLA